MEIVQLDKTLFFKRSGGMRYNGVDPQIRTHARSKLIF